MAQKIFFYELLIYILSTIYNMSGRVVSVIQTRAEGDLLYVRYNTDSNIVQYSVLVIRMDVNVHVRRKS